MDRGLNTKQAAAIAGTNRRVLDYRVRTRILRPDVIDQAHRPSEGGSGHRRRWPLREVRIAQACTSWVDAGMTPEHLATIAPLIRGIDTDGRIYIAANQRCRVAKITEHAEKLPAFIRAHPGITTVLIVPSVTEIEERTAAVLAEGPGPKP